LKGAKTVVDNVKKAVKTNAYYNGLGRMPHDEVVTKVRTDLKDISNALGMSCILYSFSQKLQRRIFNYA